MWLKVCIEHFKKIIVSFFYNLLSNRICITHTEATLRQGTRPRPTVRQSAGIRQALHLAAACLVPFSPFNREVLNLAE